MTGKSTIAKELAVRINGLILNKDVLRATLLQREDIDYSRSQDDFIMEIIFQLSKHLLSRNPDRNIILDGRPFSRRYQRDALRQAAKDAGTKLFILECVCSDESARIRLQEAREAKEHLAANRDFSLYRRLKDSWQEIKEPHLVLDTDRYNLGTCVQTALTYLEKKKHHE